MKSDFFLGIMTGTSMDGIDIALCRIDARDIELVAYREYPFDDALKAELETLLAAGAAPLQAIGRLDAAVGEMLADAAVRFMDEEKINARDVTALGMHGQTVWHAPSKPHAFSWQLGDANRVAYRTGVRVVADVRRADIAAGGQGAPLAPAFHKFIFKDIKPPFGVLNLGGIANLTVIDDAGAKGFDTGPANTLLDIWAHRHLGTPYDADGRWAQGGKPHPGLLEAMLRDAYFSRKPPKSTGREHFNLAWLMEHLEKTGEIAPADVQRTLVELTARSIADAAASYGLRSLIVCGGGARNAFLLERIAALGGIALEVPPFADAMEAMLMAYIAYKRVHREPLELQTVTGAAQPRVPGALYEP